MRLDFQRKHPRRAAIPTTCMGDIAFLLLIFFMVSSVFVKERGLVVDLPRAEGGEAVRPEGVASVYIDRSGRISIDDRLVAPREVSALIGRKLAADPGLVVALKADRRTPCGVVSGVMEELKAVNALRVLFSAAPEGDAGRGR